MTTMFAAPGFLFTSESVTEGHPDKLCDQISDGVLDAVLALDPLGRVACETAVTTGLVLVMGEITTAATVDYSKVARDVVARAGYTDAAYGFDAATCSVMTSVKEQSADIAGGVGRALEVRGGDGADDEIAALGAGDQGMMIGFACRETEALMPLPITLAHRLVKRLAEVRGAGSLAYLRPDGKSQVSVEYAGGVPRRVTSIVLSTQHDPDVDNGRLREDLVREVIAPSVPEEYLDGTEYYINPSGRFVIGGPMGDAGVTGRKIIVDTYGGMASHGGGAFSGKDPTKVDRSGAYAARWVAKNLVAAGLVDRVELQIAYAIGKAEPVSLGIETFATHHVDPARIDQLVRDVFDLRPGAIIRDLDLRRPWYQATASYGHFGENAAGMPWEQADRGEMLANAVGAHVPAAATAS